MAAKLTDRQQEVLSFIQSYITENDYSPTQSEIATAFSFSIKVAREYVIALSRKGYLDVTHGLPRGIKCVA